MKTKSLLVLNVIVILSIVLAACSKSSNQASNSGSDTDQSSGLSQANLLLVGTLKLEDTDNAVSADQASQLLPLWQAYRSLSSSQTAAEAEVDALLSQIESSMTADQMTAIKAMNLANSDMLSLMQSMGGMGPQGTPNPNATPGVDFPGGAFSSGNFPEGFQPPDDGGGGSTGGRPSGGGGIRGDGPLIIQGGPGMGDAGSAAGLNGGQMLQGTPDPTMQARFVTQASRVNNVLLNVLITKLETMTKQ